MSQSAEGHVILASIVFITFGDFIFVSTSLLFLSQLFSLSAFLSTLLFLLFLLSSSTTQTLQIEQIIFKRYGLLLQHGPDLGFAFRLGASSQSHGQRGIRSSGSGARGLLQKAAIYQDPRLLCQRRILPRCKTHTAFCHSHRTTR